MPYTEFICPDGSKCKISDCLNKCRLSEAFEAERCLSLPTLRAVAEQREWTGLPSTTQLLKGTREVFLELTNNYAVNPQSMMWSLFGTGVHAALEKYADEDDLAEERLYGKYSSGSPDRFEKSTGFLWDYKTYGSFKTQKTLGLYEFKTPICNKDGQQLKYRNGRLMWKKEWKVGHRSRLDLAIQLNDYRMKIEALGYTVKKMFGEILTRDGGTYIAEQRGIFDNAQPVRINKISDIWITRYMKVKSRRLLHALETNELPAPCSYRERWGGRKCSTFCNVWHLCDVGIKEHKKEEKDG